MSRVQVPLLTPVEEGPRTTLRGPSVDSLPRFNVRRVTHDTDVETVSEFLARLGARSPAPAGGAVAAMCLAQAAALGAMVGRFCDAEPLVEQAEQLVARAGQLADDDERAFAAVADAWALPHDDQARRSAIDRALVAASEPQARVVETALEVLLLLDRLRPSARPGVAADLVAAAEVARAGSAIARRNVESNLRGLPRSDQRSGLLRRVGVAQGRT